MNARMLHVTVLLVSTFTPAADIPAQGIQWFGSLAEARKTGRPIAYLRVLGDLDDKL